MSSSGDIENYTVKNPIVYVTRDIERAQGITPKNGYFVVSNDSVYGREVAKKYPDGVFLIKGKETLDTFDLLVLPEVQKIISDRKAAILVFQNTARIERLAQEKKWRLLNPSATLAQNIEEKISQVKWLGEDASLLPPHKVCLLKEVSYTGTKFVLQFNHSHTGQGTFIIERADELEKLKVKFPHRECRVVDFIEGPVFTVNISVGEKIVMGNTSYQITGLPPFTDLPFSTIGNDWALPHTDTYKKAEEAIKAIGLRVARRMKDAGWRGLFGIDLIYDEKARKTYLLEINARQPASTVFESKLQKETFPGNISIFEAHIASLTGITLTNTETKPLCSGSQIVVRVTHISHNIDTKALRAKGFTVMEYENTIHNKELFRIQSSESIMEAHGKLNRLGTFIASCIK